MRNFRKHTVRTLAAVAAAAGALTAAGVPANATPGGVPANAAPAAVPASAALAAGCVTTDIHLDPAAREAGWTVECTDRRYVFVDVTVFAGGVADSNPSEARWVDAGDTWQDLNVYPQTTPAIDHLCVHIVTYVDPTNPFEQPQAIGHKCI